MIFIKYLVSIIVFLVCAYVVFRVLVRRDYQRSGRLTWVSSLLETTIFFLYGCLIYTFVPADWPVVHVPPFLKAIGWSAIIVGAIIAFGTLAWFGFPRAMGVEVNVLRKSGPYSMTRNPQLLAYGLVVAGFALLWPSWYALGWASLYPVITHMMVLTEEDHLKSVFGEEYERYCKRVPRYVGFRGNKNLGG